MITSLKIAWRFLITNKIQTLIIILGIAVGVSVQVFIGLLSKGLENSLLNKVAGNSAHIVIYGAIEDYQQKKETIKKLDSQIVSVAPNSEYNAFVRLNNTTEPVRIQGFIPQDLDSLYNIKSKIYKGRTIENTGEVLMGIDLKEKLGLQIGDKIDIVTINNRKTQLTIVGFYDLGSVKVNRLWLITNLQTSQDLIGFGDRVNSIEISIKDPYNADYIAKKIENGLSDSKLKVENWKTQNKLLLSAIVGQKICSIIIQFFVLLSAVLSIISILGISVVQKYKQIGILKSMGMKDGSSALIFILKAFILGMFGTGLGILLTLIYIKAFNIHIISSEGTPLINIVIDYNFIIISSVIDIIASTLAAILPAIKTFKLTPMEVIKNG
ncbi:permease [Clostridium polyendosporum]|uniref:Permease n=1 Tax=Clostridium polyendosporum TaxID=69208 RepID=A0A919S1Q3_9CLOT|nr:ABC transporter permease [Clostridium polyendosporum]GIM28988.1 permease [Clostridium polyendosporum]